MNNDVGATVSLIDDCLASNTVSPKMLKYLLRMHDIHISDNGSNLPFSRRLISKFGDLSVVGIMTPFQERIEFKTMTFLKIISSIFNSNCLFLFWL